MSVVTAKGQVTIPKAVRDALSIGPGSSVDFVMDPDGRIVLRKAGVPTRPPSVRSLLTRDSAHYSDDFPTIRMIVPE